MRAPILIERTGGKARLAGFTVVEMVVVITLLAILSTVAISRLVGPSAFDPLLLRDYLVAQNAHARQIALNRQDADVQLVIDRTVNGVRTRVRANGAIIADRTSETDAPLTIGLATFAVGQTLTISYNGDGYLASATHDALPLNVGVGVGITVSDLELCMYPRGIATAGACA